MTLSLPLELQFEVLGHIISEYTLYNDVCRSCLIACCLVCMAWLPICQRALLDAVDLHTYKQLIRFCDRLSSTHAPVYTPTTSLSLNSTHGDKPLHHVAPLFLANKLPFLRTLSIWGSSKTAFVVRSVLTMHINHFRATTYLKLWDLEFQSIWDFRRLVVAFPALVTLDIFSIGLHNIETFQQQRRIPSLGPGSQKLRHLSISSCSGWDPLWLWVVSPTSQYRRTQNVPPYPMLSLHDIRTIGEVNDMIHKTLEPPSWKIEWEYDEGEQQCKLKSLNYRGAPNTPNL